MVSKITKEKKGFNERKTTVFKKAKELSTLCDVDLLLIMYGSDQPNVPQVYCSKPECANDIIGKYYKRDCNKVVGNSKKQELKHNVDKNEFIKDLGIDDLRKLAGVLEGKIESAKEKLNLMKQADLGSDYHCSQLATDRFEGFDLGDVGYAPVFPGYEGKVDEIDSRQPDVGSDYYSHGVVDSQLVTDCFDGFDLGDVDYAPLFPGYEGKIDDEIDSRQAGVGSDCFHNQMLVFGGYEGTVEDMGERVNQIEDVDLQELLMQIEVDDFGFEDFNAQLLY